MHLWLLLASVFIIQESLSAAYVVLQAYQAHYSILLITLLWLLITFCEVGIGYVLGKWVQKRFAQSKFERWIAQQVTKLTDLIGKNGERISLIVFTILTLPFGTGFVASWLPISFWNILLFGVIGDLIWYGMVWVRVLGAQEFATTLQSTIITFIVIGIISSIVGLILRKRFIRK